MAVSHRARAVVVVCSLALAAACGGGDSEEGRAPDPENVPSATLPAELPTPFVVGGGSVQVGDSSTYTIRSGDTLAGIADRFGISLDDLRAANPDLNPATLTVGDVVRLPSGATPSAATPADAEEPDDTPEPEPTPEPAEPEPTATASSLGQTYVVKAGDTPETIAQQFGITTDELLAANPGVSPTGLQIGQTLIIPEPAASD